MASYGLYFQRLRERKPTLSAPKSTELSRVRLPAEHIGAHAQQPAACNNARFCCARQSPRALRQCKVE